MIQKLCIVGGGLIGASIIRDARDQGLAATIAVFDNSMDHRTKLLDLGYAHHTSDTIQSAVNGADLVILCVPVGSIGAAASMVAPHLKIGAIVSDVGSTKGSILRELQAELPETVHIVPGHPVAGSEKSGPASALMGLFRDRWCILTPPVDANAMAVDTVIKFWRGLGSMVTVMDAEHHDKVLGVTSHLPHLIAYAVVGTAKNFENITDSEVIKFSAGGFRDFTRIAASDPTMWRDVFLKNKDTMLELLNDFRRDLDTLEVAIENEDGIYLHQFFSRTRDVRREIVDAKMASGPDYFGPEAPLRPPYNTD